MVGFGGDWGEKEGPEGRRKARRGRFAYHRAGMVPLRIRQVQVTPLAIPMRMRFEHAAAARDVADPILVRVSCGAPYAHHAGYGETLARDYVTGETVETVMQDIRELLAPRLAELRVDSFAGALEFIDGLPMEDDGRVIHAARAAVELALIDLAGKVFRRRAADVAGWMGLASFGAPGCVREARYSGFAVGRTPGKVGWLVRAQRFYGIRDFKIKVATAGWEERLAAAHGVLGSAIGRGRATLRADANAGWSYEEVIDALPLLERCGVSALEQPMRESDDAILPDIASRTSCALIADESLLGADDGQRLIETGGVGVFNIRIAKNGGLMPALRLARLALQNGIDVQLGCLVGETSVLAAAGAAFLASCPRVRFVEGALAPVLLRSDIVRRSLRPGWGGRVRELAQPGLGIEVDEERIGRLAAAPSMTLMV